MRNYEFLKIKKRTWELEYERNLKHQTRVLSFEYQTETYHNETTKYLKHVSLTAIGVARGTGGVVAASSCLCTEGARFSTS